MHDITPSRLAFVLPCWLALKLVGPLIIDGDNPLLRASLKDLAANAAPALATAGLCFWASGLAFLVSATYYWA